MTGSSPSRPRPRVECGRRRVCRCGASGTWPMAAAFLLATVVTSCATERMPSVPLAELAGAYRCGTLPTPYRDQGLVLTADGCFERCVDTTSISRAPDWGGSVEIHDGLLRLRPTWMARGVHNIPREGLRASGGCSSYEVCADWALTSCRESASCVGDTGAAMQWLKENWEDRVDDIPTVLSDYCASLGQP